MYKGTLVTQLVSDTVASLVSPGPSQVALRCPASLHDVSKKRDAATKERALGRFQLEIRRAYSTEDFP